MSYALKISKEAEKDLKRLDKAIIRQIREKLEQLARNADAARHSELSGDLAGLFRVRIGKYRAVYMVDEKREELMIVRVGHREDLYNKGAN